MEGKGLRKTSYAKKLFMMCRCSDKARLKTNKISCYLTKIFIYSTEALLQYFVAIGQLVELDHENILFEKLEEGGGVSWMSYDTSERWEGVGWKRQKGGEASKSRKKVIWYLYSPTGLDFEYFTNAKCCTLHFILHATLICRPFSKSSIRNYF